MNKKIVAIDSQRLEAMQYCTCFTNYKFNRNLVPINTPDYLERGSLIHHMLAEYYKLRKEGTKDYDVIVQMCIDAGRQESMNMQLDIAEVEETITVFNQYAELWENDSWNDIIAVEQVGAKILHDTEDLTILYEVKIDLVLRIAGNIISVDHKHSKSRRDPNQLSNQFKGYSWFLGTNNHIVNEIGFQKTVKPAEKFRRHLINFPATIIAEWVENTVYTVKDYLKKEEDNFFPRNYSSCDKFSGCDYKNVCIAEPGDLREFRLRKDFKERVWDVGKEHL